MDNKLTSRKALYYPFPSISNDIWLKSVALTWDAIYRITPIVGFKLCGKPSRIEEILEKEDAFIRDIEINRNTPATSLHSCEMLAWMASHAKAAMANPKIFPKGSPFSFLFAWETEKFESYFSWGIYEPHKGSMYWLEGLEKLGLVKFTNTGIYFEKSAGMVYMALLAGMLSREYQIPIITDDIPHLEIIEQIEFNRPLIQELYINALTHDLGDLYRASIYDGRPYREEDLKLPELDLTLALCRLAFESIDCPNISEVSLGKIMNFRKKYKTERQRYLDTIRSVANQMREIESKEALIERLDVFSVNIRDSLDDLRKALKSEKIESKIRWLSISLTIPLADSLNSVVGVYKPFVYLAGLALGSATALHKGAQARKTILQDSSYAYLHCISKELNPKNFLSRKLCR